MARNAAAIVAIALALAPAAAQTLGPGYPDRYPPPLPKRRGPAPPPLAFTLVGTLPVLGPVSAAGAGIAGGNVVVHGPLGFVAVPLTPGGDVAPSPAPPPAPATDAEGWVYAPDGGWRFRTMPEGRVLAQRWRGRRLGWRQDWTLRVGGATPAPPVLVMGRVVFGSLDNQIYAVRADNGHRLWATDMGDRVSRPLSLWRGAVEAKDGPREVEAVLAAPDDSLSVVALDVFDGSRLAAFSVADVPEGNAIVSAPLVTPEGRVVVAHQGYAPEEASVLLLQLHASPSGSEDARAAGRPAEPPL